MELAVSTMHDTTNMPRLRRFHDLSTQRQDLPGLPTIIQTPHTTNSTPAVFPKNNPRGVIFSMSTSAVMMAIHQMFITPATNSSSIRNQQQPLQYAPCLRPMANTPHLP